MHSAWMSETLPGQLVRCQACNHYCKIVPGHTGICGVRQNQEGKLVLLVYGRAVSLNIDPVEKKPLYHFFPGSQVFSFGTFGCNFHCTFCQNWDISQYHKTHTLEEIKTGGLPLSPRQIIDYCQEKNLTTIAYTYNEPAIFFEYAYDTAKLAHAAGIKNIYVSNGYESPEALTKILPYLDAANIDIKSFSEKYYQKICGGRLAPVLENIRWLWENGVWVETTTLLTTGENDSDIELNEIAKWQAHISPDMPWHISRYFPAYKMQNPATPLERLERAYDIGKAAGLKYVYVGNVSGSGHEDTLCPHCQKIVIERTGYEVTNHLSGDKCVNCGEKVGGRIIND